MPNPMDKVLLKRAYHERAYHEYVWFALTLLVVLFASMTRQNKINETQTRNSAVQTFIDASR